MKLLLVAFLVVGAASLAGGTGAGQEPKLRATLECPAEVLGVALSPNGKLLAFADQAAVRLWNVTTGQQSVMLLSHNLLDPRDEFGARRYSLAFSPDGRMLATGDPDAKITLWEVASRTVRVTLTGHTKNVFTVAFSDDGTLLASGSWDKTVKLWDVKTGTEKATLKGHFAEKVGAVYSVAFSPDGKLLASGSGDTTLKLWDVKTGNEKATLRGHTEVVTSVAFSPDGTVLASGSGDTTVKLWDVKSFNEKATLKGDKGVSSVAFNGDGTLLASGGSGMLKLWKVKPGPEIAAVIAHTPDTTRSLVFSRDGKLLVSAGGTTVKLWDISAIKKAEK